MTFLRTQCVIMKKKSFLIKKKLTFKTKPRHLLSVGRVTIILKIINNE